MQRFRQGGRRADVQSTRAGVWAVIAPFNFPVALSAGPAGAALVTPHHQAVRGRRTVRTPRLHITEAGVPRGAVNIVDGAGGRGWHALVNHPGVDGITFAHRLDAVGMGIVTLLLHVAPQAGDLRDGSRPGDRGRLGRPRTRRRRRRPGRVRVRRSRNMLGGLAGVRRRVDRRRVRRPTRGAGAGDMPLPRHSSKAVSCHRSSTSRRSTATRPRSPTPASRARCSRVEPASTTGTTPATTWHRRSCRAPDDSMIWTTELFVPLIAVDEWRRSTRRSSSPTPCRSAHGGVVRRGSVGRRSFPRPDRGRRRLHQSCRRARPPAPGPACGDRAGAGSAAAPPARPVAAPTPAVPPRAEPHPGGVQA